jgi:eukaryotic-like serine/threonine-protein kinase
MDDFQKQKTIPYEPSDEPAALTKTPEKIGPYKIDSLLDKGGMSILYLSTHPETKAPIVIKVLEPKFLSRPEVVQRFIQETQIIGMPSHPNIVKLYSHGEWEGGLYIAMEYVQGISLRQYLLKTPISLKKALEIVIDIAYALCHLHTHGIIHRDLKPENVLITKDNKVKVIDFGIAQLLTEQPDPHAPAKQHIIGTPVYMSPEQRENPDTVSYPSDIYSLGIITYELVLGKLSYGQIHLGLVPKGLRPILQKSLQQKPGNRYQDVVDFITDITLYLESDLSGEEEEAKKASPFEAQASLQPAPPIDWPGMAVETIPSKDSFYDFYRFADHLYGIVLGKCYETEAENLFETAIMCGMVRALCKMEHDPTAWITALNNMLIEDRIKPSFGIHFLLIDLEKKEFSYTSSDKSALWVYHDEKLERIPLDNPPLGQNKEAQFEKVVNPWREKDLLILTTGEQEEAAALLPQIIINREGERQSPFTVIIINKFSV